jgi:phosphatidylglycerophosphate synthase
MNTVVKISFILVLAAVVLYPLYPLYAPYVMALGAAGIAVMHLRELYEGRNLRLKRIYRLRRLVAVLFLIASFCMFTPKTTHGAWLALLLVSAILEIYTLWVIDYEQKKGRG